jgi:hypothetical protein
MFRQETQLRQQNGRASDAAAPYRASGLVQWRNLPVLELEDMTQDAIAPCGIERHKEIGLPPLSFAGPCDHSTRGDRTLIAADANTRSCKFGAADDAGMVADRPL